MGSENEEEERVRPFNPATLKVLYPTSNFSSQSQPPATLVDNMATSQQHVTPNVKQLAPAQIFPFEKLPMELQLHVLRFTMPQYGIRPRLRPHMPHGYYDDSDIASSRRVREGDLIPVYLFQVSKWISTQALAIFHEVFLHTDVYPRNPYFLGWFDCSTEFPSYLLFAEVLYFKRMRNFHLNIRYDNPSWKVARALSTYGDNGALVKERVRTVADVLSTNENIRSLTVTIPCQCTLKDTEIPFQVAERTILDSLQPLKRLRVAESVRIVPSFVNGTRESRPYCTRSNCQRLAQKTKASLGQLVGEELSDKEETWKLLKAMPRPSSHTFETTSQLWTIWECLNSQNDLAFEAYTKILASQLRYWVDHKRRKNEATSVT